MKSKSKEQEIQEEVYAYKNFPMFWIALAIIIFLPLGIILNLPLEKLLDEKLSKTLSRNRACPISYEKLTLEMMPPGITLKKPVVNGRCFSNPSGKLELKDVKFLAMGPSISPLGLKFKAAIKHKRKPINSYLSVSPFGHVLKVDKAAISSDLINAIAGKSAMSGKLTLNALIKTSINGTVETGSLHLKSKNLTLKPISLQQGLFTTPLARLGNLSVKAQMDSLNKILLKQIIIGNKAAPLKANFTGNISRMKSYQVQGSLLLNDEFIKKNNLGLVNIFLQGKPKTKDGAYKLKVSGKLGSPTPPKVDFLN